MRNRCFTGVDNHEKYQENETLGEQTTFCLI